MREHDIYLLDGAYLSIIEKGKSFEYIMQFLMDNTKLQYYTCFEYLIDIGVLKEKNEEKK